MIETVGRRRLMPHYYQSVQGYFDFEHVYRDAVSFMPEGGTFVEVGCWKGMSLSFLLVEARNRGKRFNVFGVDHFAGSVGDQPLNEMASRSNIEAICRANVAKAGYPVKLIRSTSWDGARHFADGSCDYVFIDGSHDYQSVCKDLRAWAPKVRQGGYLAGHDINQSEVVRAVIDCLPDKPFDVLPRHEDDGGPMWGTCFRIQM